MKDMPVNVTSVSNAQIKENNYRTVADAVNSQPSVSYGQYGTLGGQVNIMLRGSTSEEVLVLVDGRRINSVSMGLVDLGTIPLDNVDRIEIIRGGACALYGTSAFGGCVNIITKKATDETPSLDLSVTGGSFNTQRYNMAVQAKKEKLSVFASAGQTLSDGYRQNSDFRGNDFTAKFGLDLSNAGQFELSTIFHTDKSGVPGLGITLDKYDGTTEKLASTPDARQTNANASWKLEHLKSWDAYSLKSTVYSTNKDGTYEVPSYFEDQEYKTLIFGGEEQFYNRIGTTAGIEWWEEMYKQLNNLAGVTQMDKSRVTTAGYVQQELKYGKFIATPSVRFDANSAFDNIFSPHLTVIFQANETVKLSANSGKVWRAPTFNELYWPLDTSIFSGVTYVTLGNLSLVPEEGVASDVGAEYSFNSFKTKLTAFYTESKDLISWDTTVDPVTGIVTTMPENIGKSIQTGSEFEVSQKIVSGLYHKLNYTYLWAEDTVNNTPLIYRPRNTVNYDISYLTAWNMTFDAQVQYISSQETGTTPTELPEFALLNFGVTQKIKDFNVWGKVNNLTDKKYQSRASFNGGYPLPGINFSAGLTVKFWG
jgi:outer membrane cobalamin receptor